jgi:hypothetical protein
VFAVAQDAADPAGALPAGSVLDEDPDTVVPGAFDDGREVDR